MSKRLVTAILAIVVGGCVQPAAAPLLDDPREVLARTLSAALELRTAAIRVEAQSRNPGIEAQSFTADGLVDLGAGEAGFSGRTGDADALATMIVAGGNTFVQNGAGPRWQMVPGNALTGGLGGMALFGAAPGDPPDIPAALLAALADPTTVVELKGVEDCEGGRCYRTAIVVAPDRVWALILELTGLGTQPGVPVPDQPPGEIPPLNLEIVSSTASFLPVEISFAVDANGTSFAARAIVSRHNEEVAIEAPPEALVDRWDAGFGGMPPEQVDTLTPAPSFPDGS